MDDKVRKVAISS